MSHMLNVAIHMNGTHMHTITNTLMHMYNAEHMHMHYTLMYTHTMMQTHNPVRINV